MKQAKRIFYQALLMTAVSLLMRTVSVSFSVYVSNRIGAEAMGVYSLLSGVYGFALTLATSGIYLGTTRMISEAIGKEEASSVRPIMCRCVLYCLFFGTIASILLFTGAPYIGRVWLEEVRTISSLRLLAVTLPLISLTSCFSGYFTAVRRVYKNAASQIIETAARIGLTGIFLVRLTASNIESACLALVMGGILSDIVAFLANFVFYLTDRNKQSQEKPIPNKKRFAPELLGITLPVAFSTYARSGLVTLQHILTPIGLSRYGASRSDALSAYGTLHSMVLPVVLYPSAIISSFSGLLVPEVSESRVKGEKKRELYIMNRVFTFAMFFSIGVAGILCCYSKEIGEMIYPGTDAGRYIRILAPLIPIMYVDTAVDAILKGLGQQIYSMNINILDALISVALVWILLPQIGITGYIITIYITETFNTALSLARLMKLSGFLPSFKKTLLFPALCILGATAGSGFLFAFLATGWNPLPKIILHITVTVILYLFLLILTKTVNQEELHWIANILHKSEKDTA